MYRRCGKRLLDLVLASLALMLLAPVLAVVALLVRRRLGAPVLFTQERLGLDGKPFAVRKFRTMTDARDATGNLLPDAARLTPFGAWLRATSLDELPELVNVLRGEMSIVGPRPLFVRYKDRYTPAQMRRHDVRPGLTGWAQVHGRNALGWEERFTLDVWYVDHCSLWLDLRIIGRTLRAVITRTGINEDGQATMSEFMGTAAPAEMEVAA
jgi:lipopolysaccharide/colanic/teichoic acid biosynthesis glycosyltransferase